MLATILNKHYFINVLVQNTIDVKQIRLAPPWLIIRLRPGVLFGSALICYSSASDIINRLRPQLRPVLSFGSALVYYSAPPLKTTAPPLNWHPAPPTAPPCFRRPCEAPLCGSAHLTFIVRLLPCILHIGITYKVLFYSLEYLDLYLNLYVKSSNLNRRAVF